MSGLGAFAVVGSGKVIHPAPTGVVLDDRSTSCIYRVIIYLGVQTAQRCKTSTKKKILKKSLSPGFEIVFHCGFM